MSGPAQLRLVVAMTVWNSVCFSENIVSCFVRNQQDRESQLVLLADFEPELQVNRPIRISISQTWNIITQFQRSKNQRLKVVCILNTSCAQNCQMNVYIWPHTFKKSFDLYIWKQPLCSPKFLFHLPCLCFPLTLSCYLLTLSLILALPYRRERRLGKNLKIFVAHI